MNLDFSQLEKMEKAILEYRFKKHPNHRSVNRSKKFSHCPRCNANSTFYNFSGRWKVCEVCGYDRYFETKIKGTRSIIKRKNLYQVSVLESCYEYINRLKPIEGEPHEQTT